MLPSKLRDRRVRRMQSDKVAIGGSKIRQNFTPSIRYKIYVADAGPRSAHGVQHFLALLRKGQKWGQVKGRWHQFEKRQAEFATPDRTRQHCSVGICDRKNYDVGIDARTQLSRDRRDVLLLIIPSDPRQHGNRKGESDHNPVAG